MRWSAASTSAIKARRPVSDLRMAASLPSSSCTRVSTAVTRSSSARMRAAPSISDAVSLRRSSESISFSAASFCSASVACRCSARSESSSCSRCLMISVGAGCFAALSALDCGDSAFCSRCLARSAGAGRFSGLVCPETIPTARTTQAARAMRLQETDAIGAGNVIGCSPIPSFANSAFAVIPAQLATNSDQLGQDHAAGKHAIVRQDDKAKAGASPSPSLAMVRMSGQDRKGPINLLQQHDSHELMGPGRSTEGEAEVGALA